jgi:hypothetical protein
MTTADEISGDPYPRAWRPSWAPEFEEPKEVEPEIQPLAAEIWLASLSDEEFTAVTKRARGGRS